MAFDLKTASSFRSFASVSGKFLNMCLILYPTGDTKPKNIAQFLELGLLKAASENFVKCLWQMQIS